MLRASRDRVEKNHGNPSCSSFLYKICKEIKMQISDSVIITEKSIQLR